MACHNRYHYCKYVATRLCDGATAISDKIPDEDSDKISDEDSSQIPVEFKNYQNIFKIKGKGLTESQIKRLNVLRQALELGHAKVPLPLLPDAYRSMSTYLCTYMHLCRYIKHHHTNTHTQTGTVMRDLLQVSKNKGGLVELALEIRKGQDASDSTKLDTEFQDQVDMFLCATFEASRCILREIGISTTKNSTEAELRKRTRSEAHLKMMAIQECVPMKGTIEITEQEYVQARMLELSSLMLAKFCERVHETWKQAALEVEKIRSS